MEGYQKVAVFLEDSGLLEGKLSLSIDVRMIQLYAATWINYFLSLYAKHMYVFYSMYDMLYAHNWTQYVLSGCNSSFIALY